jgi:phosphate starvation-inducible PhoH-like protein
LSVYAALHLLENDFDKDILYIRTVQESSSKSLGYLPGDQGSKFGPFQMPLQDKVDEIIEPYKSKELFESEKLQAIPVNYLRGASWKNKIVIIDEAQNFSFKETQTCLTRIGEGTKVFICGDNMQSDLPFGKSAFKDFTNAFNNEESRERGIFSFEFGKEDIVRSEILKFLIEKIESIPQK